MDNIEAIKSQWTEEDMKKYPHLFNMVVGMIVDVIYESDNPF